MSSVLTPRIKKYLNHIRQRKDYWFGKDEITYTFFKGQYVLFTHLKERGMLREPEERE